MDYKAVKRWMFSKLPMYQRQGAVAYKKDLSRTKLLVKHLFSPRKPIILQYLFATHRLNTLFED